MMSISSSSFGSLRSKNRPLVRRPSFRDDSSLVAIRYEKTAQREAPVPIPPRNPSRLSRPASSSSSCASCRPVVVIPPAAVFAQAQAQGPPTEEHPAFRKSPVLPHWTGAAVETERKRDSGHGSASCPSSTPTIDEEEGEHEFPPYSPKTSSVLPVVRHSRDTRPADVVTIDSDYVSVYSDNSRSTNASPVSDYQTQMSEITDIDIEPISPSSASVTHKPSQAPTSSPAPLQVAASPVRPESSDKSRESKLVRSSFSFRSVASSLMGSDRSARGGARGQADGDAKYGRQTGAQSEPVKRGQPAPKSTDDRATYSLDDRCRSLELPLESTRNSTKQSPSSTISSLLRRNPFQSHSRRHNNKPATENLASFSPLSVSIPTDDFLDDDFLNGLSFSKRGSVMLGGRRALSLDGAITDTMADQLPAEPPLEVNHNEMEQTKAGATPDIVVEAAPTPTSVARVSSESSRTGYVTPDAEPTPLASQQLQLSEDEPTPSATPSPHIRVFPAEMERESQKVRSLYLVGDADLEYRPRTSPGDRREPSIAETSGNDDGAEPSLYGFL